MPEFNQFDTKWKLIRHRWIYVRWFKEIKEHMRVEVMMIDGEWVRAIGWKFGQIESNSDW